MTTATDQCLRSASIKGTAKITPSEPQKLSPVAQIVLVTTGELGMKRQLEAVAGEISEAIRCKIFLPDLRLAKLWRFWPFSLPRLQPGLIVATSGLPQRADLLISCGRRAGLLAQYCKRLHYPAALTVHLENPRHARHKFDQIFIPQHDRDSGARQMQQNEILIQGGITPFNAKALAAATPHPKFYKLSPPRIAVLIGGPGKGLRMNKSWLAEFINILQQHSQKTAAAVAITCSRRTPAWLVADLAAKIPSNWWLWDGNGANPLASMLALADELVVTCDSTAMLLQAAATDARLVIAPLPGRRKKITRLCRKLLQTRRATMLKLGHLQQQYEVRQQPLSAPASIGNKIGNKINWNSTPVVADHICRLLQRSIAELSK